MKLTGYHAQVETTTKSIETLSQSAYLSDRITASAKSVALAVLVFGEAVGQTARAGAQIALTVVLLPLAPFWATARPRARLVSIYEDIKGATIALFAAPLIAAAALPCSSRVAPLCLRVGLVAVPESLLERIKRATKNVVCHRAFKIGACALGVATAAVILASYTAKGTAPTTQPAGYSNWLIGGVGLLVGVVGPLATKKGRKFAKKQCIKLAERCQKREEYGMPDEASLRRDANNILLTEMAKFPTDQRIPDIKNGHIEAVLESGLGAVKLEQGLDYGNKFYYQFLGMLNPFDEAFKTLIKHNKKMLAESHFHYYITAPLAVNYITVAVKYDKSSAPECHIISVEQDDTDAYVTLRDEITEAIRSEFNVQPIYHQLPLASAEKGAKRLWLFTSSHIARAPKWDESLMASESQLERLVRVAGRALTS